MKTLRLRGRRVVRGGAAARLRLVECAEGLTIHVPPDLRSGSTRKWWDVPPESVYAFSFYIWQQVQRWPTNGEDYPRNLRALSTYLTPAAGLPATGLRVPARQWRAASARARHLQIPGRGYGDDPATRVRWFPTAIGSSRST